MEMAVENGRTAFPVNVILISVPMGMVMERVKDKWQSKLYTRLKVGQKNFQNWRVISMTSVRMDVCIAFHHLSYTRTGRRLQSALMLE